MFNILMVQHFVFNERIFVFRPLAYIIVQYQYIYCIISLTIYREEKKMYKVSWMTYVTYTKNTHSIYRPTRKITLSERFFSCLIKENVDVYNTHLGGPIFATLTQWQLCSDPYKDPMRIFCDAYGILDLIVYSKD